MLTWVLVRGLSAEPRFCSSRVHKERSELNLSTCDPGGQGANPRTIFGLFELLETRMKFVNVLRLFSDVLTIKDCTMYI